MEILKGLSIPEGMTCIILSLNEDTKKIKGRKTACLEQHSIWSRILQRNWVWWIYCIYM